MDGRGRGFSRRGWGDLSLCDSPNLAPGWAVGRPSWRHTHCKAACSASARLVYFSCPALPANAALPASSSSPPPGTTTIATSIVRAGPSTLSAKEAKSALLAFIGTADYRFPLRKVCWKQVWHVLQHGGPCIAIPRAAALPLARAWGGYRSVCAARPSCRACRAAANLPELAWAAPSANACAHFAIPYQRGGIYFVVLGRLRRTQLAF